MIAAFVSTLPVGVNVSSPFADVASRLPESSRSSFSSERPASSSRRKSCCWRASVVAVETPVVERVGELARLARELRRAVSTGAVPGVLELLGDVALLPRELPRERLALAAARALRHPHQSLRLRVDLSLLLRHLLHLLDHLAEARRAI